MMSNNMHP